jgi:hypothetical protein
VKKIDGVTVSFQHVFQDRFEGAQLAWRKDRSQITDPHAIVHEIRADWRHVSQYSPFFVSPRKNQILAVLVLSMNV